MSRTSFSDVIIGQTKKILLFPEMRVKRKIFTQAAANLFFNRFSENIIFSSLVFFCFFCFLVFFVFLFVFFACLFAFLKLKIYILIHTRLWGRVSDKKFFAQPISANKTTLFGHILAKVTFNDLLPKNRFGNDLRMIMKIQF